MSSCCCSFEVGSAELHNLEVTLCCFCSMSTVKTRIGAHCRPLSSKEMCGATCCRTFCGSHRTKPVPSPPANRSERPERDARSPSDSPHIPLKEHACVSTHHRSGSRQLDCTRMRRYTGAAAFPAESLTVYLQVVFIKHAQRMETTACGSCSRANTAVRGVTATVAEVAMHTGNNWTR